MKSPWIIMFLAKYFKRYRLLLYETTLEALLETRNNFNKATIRFRDNVTRLNQILAYIEVRQTIELKEMIDVELLVRTNSSNNASRICEYLLGEGNSGLPANIDFNTGYKRLKYLDWCSNVESVNEFLVLGKILLSLYTLVYPISSNPIDFTRLKEEPIKAHLYLYLTSNGFRGFVNEYLELTIVVLEKEIEAIR